MLEGLVEIDLLVVRDFAIALFIGALVGVDRERRNLDEAQDGQDTDPYAFGGLRTFTLIALSGALAGWLSLEMRNVGVFAIAGLALGALLVASVVHAGHREARTQGITSEVAAIAVFLAGGACGIRQPAVAVVVGIAVAGLLALKQPLHAAVRKIGRDDIEAILTLAFASFVVLPILPDRTIDPWDAINPYKLWLLVVLISSISLVGYAAVRILGTERGFALTGLLAGLVSSTALTLSFARRSKDAPALSDALAMGILLAWFVMFARVIVEVSVVNRALLPAVAFPMAVLGAVTLALAGLMYLRMRGGAAPEPKAESVALTNPFSLWSAIKFAAFFAAILLVVHFAQAYLSDEWLYGVAALAGTTDVDAITLSMARLGQDPERAELAVRAIVIASVSNTLVKAGMVGWLGAPELRGRIGVAAAVITVAAVTATLGKALLGL